IYEAKSLAARELETSDAAMDTTSLDQGLETAEVTDARSTEAIPGRTPSIWVSKIKLHKLGVIIALAILVITSAAAIYFFFVQSRKSIESLAVLPFANVGADPNTEYLADGIPESIINSLSQLPKLKVMSRNSAFRFKGREA